MQVLIMRHGDAVMDAASDAQRPLSQRGRDESVQMADWLRQEGKIERVLVSPYRRAQQTLAVLQTHLTLPGDPDVLPELTPGGDATLVNHYLHALMQQGIKSVLIVSHLPLVGYLVSELCPAEGPPMFATSAVAKVSLDPVSGIGKLDWQVSPGQLDNEY